MKKRKMNKKAIVTTTVKSPNQKRIWLIVLGIGLLVAIGALGFVSQKSQVSNLKSASSLSQSVQTVATEAIPPQTGTPQLAKENIYAGSRLLATEDYGIAAPNPTPTP